jgi:hypothetical protein
MVMSKKLFTIAGVIARKTIEDQGCSMNLNGHEPVTGYMVGIEGTERKELLLDFNEGHVDSFIRANLGKLHDRNYFVGTWINGDIVVIDCSINCPDLESALLMGKINHQVCIWSVINKREIYQLEEVI